MKSVISISIITSGLVLFIAVALYGQTTEHADTVFGKEESVAEPEEKEQGLMDIMDGASANTMGTKGGEPTGDVPSERVSEGILVDEQVEEEQDLHYLDEDQDE